MPVIRRLCFVSVVTLLTAACERDRSDVLREFPPPRLAKEVLRTSPSVQMAPADCVATWRLHGRVAKASFQLPGTGQFHVRGEPGFPTAGEVRFRSEDAEPKLPEPLARALRSREPSGEWTWRLLDVPERTAPSQGLEDDIATPWGQATSEVELNAVRTRQTHVISNKLTRKNGEDSSAFETTLRLELGAHRVTGITLYDDSTPRRAELLVRCRLETSNDAE